MLFRHSLSRRDAILVLVGASMMQVYSFIFLPSPPDQSVIINTHVGQLDRPLDPLPPPAHSFRKHHHDSRPLTVTTTAIAAETATVVMQPSPSPAVPAPAEQPPQAIELAPDLPHTSIISHAPGWTVFRNLYMSNGTLFILSANRSFPEINLMTSTGLSATQDNIAEREPTADNMDIITPEEARRRWGGDVGAGEKNRVWSVEGNTFLFNDPKQFLRHYYHFVAELFFGAWAFWHGTWSTPSDSLASPFGLVHPAPPPIHRAIFVHSDADGWRDGPGFNAYFLRAAFPSLTVEVQEDWEDRVAATANPALRDRAWHFPVVLLSDRSAAHHGEVCGSQTQRTAAEAWQLMKEQDKLMGIQVGGWWEPVRAALWRFAGVRDVADPSLGDAQGLLGADKDTEIGLPLPKKVVISYISRQGSRSRKLIQEDHIGLVDALADLVARKGPSWELDVLEAEKMTKDEQVQAAARTTILLGVHGNGLTHLVFMKPTRVSAVVEIFYPEGFSHDYQWTATALGMTHFAVWNDTYHTLPNKPQINYPEGFQGDNIPVHGPTIAQLVEDRIEGRL